MNGSTYFGGAVSYNGDIVLTNPYQLKTNNISTNGLNDLVFNVDTLGEFFRCQASDFTVRLPNNRTFLAQNIVVDNLQPLSFGNDLVLNGGNSTSNAYEEYIRLDASTERVNVSKTIDTSENILMNLNKRLYLNDTVGSERYIGSTFRSGTPSFNQLDIVNENSSNGRIRLMINTEENVIIENSQLYSKRVITAVAGVKGNTYNSNGDNDVLFQRDDVEFFKVDKFTENSTEKEAIICTKQLRANGNMLVNNLQINQFSVGVQYADFRLENADSVVRYFVGNGTNANLQITNTELTLARVANCTSGLKSNTIDTYTDTDLIFRRNGTPYMTFLISTGATTYNLINTSDDVRFSTPYIFSNTYGNRTDGADTDFRGSNSAGDGKVEYMRWNYLSQQLDFNAPIDNTGIAIIGNIVDTTVSDERLKTNIQDVESNFTECVKNVKVKTFEYTDEKYKNNDKYGFIAQHLLQNLPKEFKSIVKENKEKDSDDKYLSINYMKVNLLLWGALQETLTKVEHLEASVYELQEELKDKKKSTPKSKSKAKAKNVD